MNTEERFFEFEMSMLPQLNGLVKFVKMMEMYQEKYDLIFSNESVEFDETDEIERGLELTEIQSVESVPTDKFDPGFDSNDSDATYYESYYSGLGPTKSLDMIDGGLEMFETDEIDREIRREKSSH